MCVGVLVKARRGRLILGAGVIGVHEPPNMGAKI